MGVVNSTLLADALAEGSLERGRNGGSPSIPEGGAEGLGAMLKGARSQ